MSLHGICILILSFLLWGCAAEKNKSEVVIEWKDNHATGIFIPTQLLPALNKDVIHSQIQVRLINSTVPIIGEYKLIEDAISFTPLLPFSRGLQYEILFANKRVSRFTVPLDTKSKAPAIVAVYPSSDTVPENLLKIYIQFSQPMQEGEAMKNINVLKNNKDTIPSVFLDLETELWNKDRTMLTLWLDPGRIKRDLQPNIKAGTPLHKATSYSIIINKDWRSAEGIALSSPSTKNYFAADRDANSPNPETWTMQTPKAKTNASLNIQLHEALDYVLLKNAIRVIDTYGNIVNGSFEPANKETFLNFIPSKEWEPGNYTLEIEGRLEDLAGNNLNRLFDNDITVQHKVENKKVYTRTFTIE